jgi:hypothetical protein
MPCLHTHEFLAKLARDKQAVYLSLALSVHDLRAKGYSIPLSLSEGRAYLYARLEGLVRGGMPYTVIGPLPLSQGRRQYLVQLLRHVDSRVEIRGRYFPAFCLSLSTDITGYGECISAEERFSQHSRLTRIPPTVEEGFDGMQRTMVRHA